MLPINSRLQVLSKDDIKVCNCAKCARILIGTSMSSYTDNYLTDLWGGFLPPREITLINDRPYCKRCSKIEEETKSRLDLCYRNYRKGKGT